MRWDVRCECGEIRTLSTRHVLLGRRCYSCGQIDLARRSPNRFMPIFSDEDADLRGEPWRRDAKGYAERRTPAGVVRAHRLVLERMLGRTLDAGEFCDHFNRVKHDNRRCNLSAVTINQNHENRVYSRALPRGVYHVGNRYRAVVTKTGVTHYLGSFLTAQEAAVAAAAKRLALGFHEYESGVNMGVRS